MAQSESAGESRWPRGPESQWPPQSESRVTVTVIDSVGVIPVARLGRSPSPGLLARAEPGGAARAGGLRGSGLSGPGRRPGPASLSAAGPQAGPVFKLARTVTR